MLNANGVHQSRSTEYSVHTVTKSIYDELMILRFSRFSNRIRCKSVPILFLKSHQRQAVWALHGVQDSTTVHIIACGRLFRIHHGLICCWSVRPWHAWGPFKCNNLVGLSLIFRFKGGDLGVSAWSSPTFKKSAGMHVLHQALSATGTNVESWLDALLRWSILLFDTLLSTKSRWHLNRPEPPSYE